MIDQELQAYVRDAVSRGVSKEELYKDLLAKNVTLDSIEAALRAAKTAPAHAQKNTVQVVTVLGVLSIGIGIFSWIASNWQSYGPFLKIGLIVFVMVLSYVLGWLADGRGNLPKTARALYLLGVISYGGGIYLVAQIFNIQSSWPDGFMLWSLGALATAFAVNSLLIYYAALALGAASVVGVPFYIFSGYLGREYLLTSTVLVTAMAAVLLYAGITVRNRMPDTTRNLF